MMLEASTKTPRFVTPEGALAVQTEKIGLLMGNRGILLPKHFGQNQPCVPNTPWLACLIKKNGVPIKETIVKYTKLFFLDEVTAFAAGHRPCYSCQRHRYKSFIESWEKVARTDVKSLDADLHRDRCNDDGSKRIYPEVLGKLPNGVIVRLSESDKPYLLLWGKLFPWTADGYGPPITLSMSSSVQVLTPAVIVQMFKTGFPLPLNREETIHSSVLNYL
jgi:hypothetical protein